MTLPDNAQGRRLTEEEKVTLRRVAFGESEVKHVRTHDLAQLRQLALIEDGRHGLQLTAEGRTVFEGLPMAIGRETPQRTDNMLRHMER